MDIFNRPPAISEDTLQYTIHPALANSEKSSTTSLAALIESRACSLLPNHIWHRDAFDLKVAQDPNSTHDGWLLEGRMRVGDSVDDEWCVVWLLKEISGLSDVAISVFDSDGEFLLIEAADYLPSWVTPTNSENRVWIYHSNLHLIPLSYTSSPSSKRKRRRLPGANESDDEDITEDTDEGFITTQDALRILRDPLIDTKAPKEVEDAVWRRVSGYPKLALQHLHTAKAFLPIDIAKALSQDMTLVQKASEAFYTRDAIQLRAAHRMSRFPPQPSTLTTLRVTRTAYAQLVGQKFHPPKIFGQFKERESSSQWKWRDLGMKIACGFEMLYQESKARSEVTSTPADGVKADARKDALRRNPDYVKYIEDLISAGYFKEELEGSRAWNEMEDKAASIFINVRSQDNFTRQTFASLVNAAISRASDQPLPPQQEEESDDWLNVDAEDFDAQLSATVRSSQAVPAGSTAAMEVDERSPEDQVAHAQASKLAGLAKKIESFVEGEGTMDGAVFDDDVLSDDEPMSEFSEDDSPSESVEDIDNDDKAVRQEAMDKLVAGIDPAEYGKMPTSFYTNSQKTAPVTMETETSEPGPDAVTITTSPPSKPPSKPIRRPILPRDNFDGVDSDDETDEDDVDVEDEESEEDRPQIVGDIEIDMAEEEEDFLKFSREALGISEEQWGDIVKDRKGRGAFLPSSAYNESENIPSNAPSKPVSSETINYAEPHLRIPQPGPRPNVNPDLDSFEAVMQAMDVELARSRSMKQPSGKESGPAKHKTTSDGSTKPAPSHKGKGNASVTDVDNEEDDVEDAMDAELRAALEREEEDSGDEEPMDYNLIKNFLESFKSQSGLSGPVTNLAGRLEPGWKLPRDQS